MRNSSSTAFPCWHAATTPRGRHSIRPPTTVAAARADVAEAEANHAAAVAGPTKEERAIADAQVRAVSSALAVLERHLGKTVLALPGRRPSSAWSSPGSARMCIPASRSSHRGERQAVAVIQHA